MIGIGEVVWDFLPAGPQLGGAPANFAYHAQALGARSLVVSRVGKDLLGLKTLHRFKEINLSSEAVQVDETSPTGSVTVALSDQGVPQFTIHENVAWDRLEVTPPALEAVRKANAVCFGSLAQRSPTSRAAIQMLVAAAPREALRIFDINLRQKFFSREIIEQSLHLANVLKLSEEELPVVCGMFALQGTPREQMSHLAQLFRLKLVILTRGSRGSLILLESRWSEQLPKPVTLVDTVGAGDSFTAALVMGLLQKRDLSEAHTLATEVASYVCSQPGATPPLPESFCNGG